MTFWSALFSVSLSVLEDPHFLLGNDTQPAGCCLFALILYFSLQMPRSQLNQCCGSHSSISVLSWLGWNWGGEQQLSQMRCYATPAPLSASLDCIFQMCISDIKVKHQWWAAVKSEHQGNRRMEDFSTTASGTIRAFWRVCDGASAVAQQIIKASIHLKHKKPWSNIFQPFTKSRGQNHRF